MDSELTFARLVLQKALANTRSHFESVVHDVVWGALFLAIGFAIYYAIWGLPEAKSEALPVVLFTVTPAVLVLTAVFLWHLCLAPAELVYEAARANAPASAAEEKPVNWGLWKLRSSYTVMELAAILAKKDPAEWKLSRSDNDKRAYAGLILEEVHQGKLARNPGDRDTDISIPRGDALKWAEGKSFNVDHVK